MYIDKDVTVTIDLAIKMIKECIALIVDAYVLLKYILRLIYFIIQHGSAV